MHELIVGVIRCATSADRLNAVIASAGLQAHPAEEPDAFYLTNRGRAAEPEIGRDLLDVVRAELEHAVDNGVLPDWSIQQDKRLS